MIYVISANLNFMCNVTLLLLFFTRVSGDQSNLMQLKTPLTISVQVFPAGVQSNIFFNNLWPFIQST